MMEWLLALFWGTDATFAPSPMDLPAGETFLVAPNPLEPGRISGMRVSIGVGTTTMDAKSAVLSGSVKIGDYGNLKVAVCRRKEDCVTIRTAGTFFSEESYGFIFSGTGPAIEGSRFIGVKIISDRALSDVVVSWDNFIH